MDPDQIMTVKNKIFLGLVFKKCLIFIVEQFLQWI